MARRRLNVVTPFSRDYRRPPRFGMGLPPREPGPRSPTQRRQRGLLQRGLGLALGATLTLGVVPPLADAAVGLFKDTQGCRVLAVIDGDTLRAYCPGPGLVPVRLLGFDTPEVTSPACPSELWKGIGATFALRWRIWMADTVALHPEGSDRYGRVLGRLELSGRDVAPLLVSDGWARPYDGGRRQGWCGMAPGDRAMPLPQIR